MKNKMIIVVVVLVLLLGGTGFAVYKVITKPVPKTTSEDTTFLRCIIRHRLGG